MEDNYLFLSNILINKTFKTEKAMKNNVDKYIEEIKSLMDCDKDYVSSLTDYEKTILKYYVNDSTPYNIYLITNKIPFNIYTNGFYIDFNNLKDNSKDNYTKYIINYTNKIWEGYIKWCKETIKGCNSLNNIIKKTPEHNFKKDFYIFRGERNETNNFIKKKDKLNTYKNESKCLKKGDEFKIKVFNSFSLSPMEALKFMELNKCCMYKLYIPKHVEKGKFLINYNNKKECEIIFPPGTNFKVLKKEKIYSKYEEDVFITIYNIELN